jgi:DNA-directed RNA polymerase subunit RPC12/RpoP
MALECPSCGSRRVERRPESQISPHPGYRCRNCGRLMRGRGTLFMYAGVLVIGGGFVALFVYLLASGQADWPQIFGTWIIGAICAVYSIRQLMRPTPIRVSDEEEDEQEDDEEEDEDVDDRRRRRDRRR